jgi:hypothetical protein
VRQQRRDALAVIVYMLAHSRCRLSCSPTLSHSVVTPGVSKTSVGAPSLLCRTKALLSNARVRIVWYPAKRMLNFSSPKVVPGNADVVTCGRRARNKHTSTHTHTHTHTPSAQRSSADTHTDTHKHTHTHTQTYKQRTCSDLLS